MISADHQRYRLGIVISSTTMTLADYRQRLWNVCTDHFFAKKVCQKIFGRIFQVRFATGRVFKVHFSLRTSFHRTALTVYAVRVIDPTTVTWIWVCVCVAHASCLHWAELWISLRASPFVRNVRLIVFELTSTCCTMNCVVFAPLYDCGRKNRTFANSKVQVHSLSW